MEHCSRILYRARVLALIAAVLLPSVAAADTPPAPPPEVKEAKDPNPWEFSASVYLWFASINGTVDFPTTGGSSDFTIDFSQILSHLHFAGMASFDVHKGRWGAFTDAVYLDMRADTSGTHTFTVGRNQTATVTGDFSLSSQSLIWTIAGEYRLLKDSGWTLDALAGARNLNFWTGLNWSITGSLGPIAPADRTGSSSPTTHVWDGIAGVRGRYAFGADQQWIVPFYLDGGLGNSEFTVQAALGFGYSFQWIEIIGMWRYLYDKTRSDKLQDMTISGPIVGVTFHW